ncbi:MAG: hypothetical protein KA116_11130 [Proteobacteria bacterium]|nr:hypothetical protein [Pseudomonadota bacterium]
MLKKFRIAVIGYFGVIAALFLFLTWINKLENDLMNERVSKNHWVIEGQRRITNLSKAAENSVKHVYRVLYWTKEKESRENVEKYVQKSLELEKVLLKSISEIEKWKDFNYGKIDTLDLLEKAKMINLKGSDLIRLSWAGEQAAISQQLEVYDKIFEDFLKLSTLNYTKINESKQTLYKVRQARLENVQQIQIWSSVLFLTLLIVGGLLLWRKGGRILDSSFLYWEKSDYDKSEKLEELIEMNKLLSTKCDDIVGSNSKVKTYWKEGFSLLPRACELSAKLESISKSTEERWPLLLRNQLQVKESLEALRIEVSQISEDHKASVSSLDRRLEIDLKNFEKYSELVDKHLTSIIEQKPSYTLLVGSLAQIKKAWNTVDFNLEENQNLGKMLNDLIASFHNLLGEFRADFKNAEEFRRSLELGAHDKINLIQERFIEEMSPREPNDDSSQAQSIIEYSLEEKINEDDKAEDDVESLAA